ncbi:hypothetical protein GOBAR_DD26833 [Gossypium barbadense]|nr:hypothetical protein GOBAR_DD26833 [Gossypium barbadense]
MCETHNCKDKKRRTKLTDNKNVSYRLTYAPLTVWIGSRTRLPRISFSENGRKVGGKKVLWVVNKELWNSRCGGLLAAELPTLLFVAAGPVAGLRHLQKAERE